MPLSRLTYLSANTSGVVPHHLLLAQRSTTDGDLTDAALTRQFLSLRSDVIGPVLTKIWDTPDERAPPSG